jgi:APA family basic amino acid/polyamine antiporter
MVVLIVLAGIRLSARVNAVVVAVTIGALGTFVFFLLGDVDLGEFSPFLAGEEGDWGGFFEATALMFVAYTGYGRIATLGEEVERPERTVPKAIAATLLTAMVLYVAVAFVAVGAAGAEGLAAATMSTAAPLEAIARALDRPAVATIVAVGAVTAMLGVLLNLVLGLSRVLLAMGRRGDMPRATARLDPSGRTPYVSIVVIGLGVAALTAIGDVRLTWSFSALNVLIYYAITNGAALRMPSDLRRFPRWIAVAGLISCLLLAAFIEPALWLVGGGVLLVGLTWHALARRRLR